MASILHSLYAHVPVPIQNLGISFYGYQWQKRRFGGIFQQELKGFKERENFTLLQWRDYQTVRLRQILKHAFETVPYYREKFKYLGFTLSALEKFELEALPSLPVLEKETLRKHGTTNLVSTRRERNGEFFSSSGSTGTPTRILYSTAFHQRMTAAMEARVRNWAGVAKDDPRGMIGGRRVLPKANNTPPFYRYNYFEKQTYFSAYHISRGNAADYLKGILAGKVRFMTGYAMSNYFLASFFEELSLEAPALKAVITSSEKLTAPMRKTFERVYGCKAYDSYSGVENCGLISENGSGELMISPDVGILEVVNSSGNPVGPGEEGELICTGLLNFDQPLIRYRIGDRVKLASQQASKTGLGMPIIEEIIGRTEDVVMTTDGRQMVRFHGIFVDLPNVLEAQVIQHQLNRFTVKVVSKPNFSTIEKELIEIRMKSQLGEQVSILVEAVGEIPRTQNGKFRAVISELNTGL